jgi:hypothetical protein
MSILDHPATIDYLISKTKKTGDVTWIVERLRDTNRSIPPELRDYIATLLELKHKSEKLAKYRPPPSELKLQINSFKAILRGETEIPWSDVIEALKNIGVQDEVFDTKGKITEVAKAMTMWRYGLTANELDEAIHPRKHRNKLR